MVNGILGKKLGMTQVFDESGQIVPVTVVEAGPCVVTQIKTVENDGYEGVQVAFGDVKEKRVNKPIKGHLAKSGCGPKRHIAEMPFEDLGDVTLGQEIKADIFSEGDIVKVTGTSKGKGFAGAVKRYHFHGADMTHGSMIHRKPQSGGATDAARTFKGVRRPGHMGNATITQRGLTVYRVDAFRNLLLIKGALPGANGGLLFIRRQMVGG
ncbi:MAG: 50S ribosomal protein L3 [Armatimonadetes bacterium]|nr:50S ribosomal protein L3 [Armatimonadota bacterium]